MLRNVIQSIEATEAGELSDNLSERRRALRVRCYAHVELTIDGEKYKGVATDIGLEGIRVKSVGAPLIAGSDIAVRYPGSTPGFELGVVRCQVLWAQRVGREFVAGLRYADSKENMRRSWIRYLLMELGFDETRTYQRRKHIRVDGSLPARVFSEGEQFLVEPRVVNLGVGGALLEARNEGVRGIPVEVEISLWRILPTLCLAGHVIDVRQEPGTGLWLHSVQFTALDSDQIKLLGNYVINMINQTSP